jgi:hypothetical protein
VVIESVIAVIEVSDGSERVRLRFDRGAECLRWWCGDLRFDRLIPRGAAAWSASLRNWLRSVIKEKERGWREKQVNISKGAHMRLNVDELVNR